MGCDIHLYIEYRNKSTSEKRWSSFGGRIRVERAYLFFGIIAKGVRSVPEFSYPCKGMPEDAAHESSNDNLIYISDAPLILTDFHSHSWLSTQEYAEALKFFNEHSGFKLKECEAVLARLKRFEELGCEARVVFWFDN